MGDDVDFGGRSHITEGEGDLTRQSSAIGSEAWDDAVGGFDELAELGMDAVLELVTRMTANMTKLVEDGQALPAEALQELTALHGELVIITQRLTDGKHYVDERNDVDALVDFKHLAWSFNNPDVAHYRATARTRRHSDWTFTNWHIPEYFSAFPLPPQCSFASCVVALPTPATNDPAAMAHTTTRIHVNDKGMGSTGVQQAFEKIKTHAGHGDVSDYVLKAQGLADYILPHRRFFDYQYVRKCLRDQVEVKLSLVRRPSPLPCELDDFHLQEHYRSKPAMTEGQLLTEDTHRDVQSPAGKPWFDVEHVPMHQLALPWRVRLCGLDRVDRQTLPRLQDYDVTAIFLRTRLFHGAKTLAAGLAGSAAGMATAVAGEGIIDTRAEVLSSSPRWYHWAELPSVDVIPRSARLGISIMGRVAGASEKKSVCLGYVVHQLVDLDGVLTQGTLRLAVWGLPAKSKGKHAKTRDDPNFIYRATNRPNLASKHPCILRIDLPELMVTVVAPLEEKWREPNLRSLGMTGAKSSGRKTKEALRRIKAADPLDTLPAQDQHILWVHREDLKQFPSVLPKFLQCVNWGDRENRFEALRLLREWAPPSNLVSALELLDNKYPNYSVRKYAVDILRGLTDEDLQLYLLQFIQCLKFEPYHDSPLSRFLLERAIRSPYVVGHHFFWHLKAELHHAPFSERFGLLLEEYLSHCGRYAAELRKQNNAVLKLQRVAELIVKLKREEGYGDDVCKREYMAELRKLNQTFFGPMGKFHIPLDPKWQATTLILDKCRYMSSKMVPLWLVFENADETAPPIYIMFKSGDDLRQDILTLQMLKIMDALWLAANLDMRLRPYKCVATGVNEHGDGVGMLEIVLNSDTTSGIQLEYGGGAMGALKMTPIDLFLHDHNKGGHYDNAVNNFLFSCAGYCVATFVMGIGDRHNGNIMVTKDGHLFHIDFGHFLGNFKSKFGVKRERAAFVFTPEMAFVMGGKRYKRSEKFQTFMQHTSMAYAILRDNAPLLETMFLLMVAAGMPELLVEKDIHYLKDMLHLGMDARKADKQLALEINKSLNTTYRRLDNMIHNFKHGH